MINRKELKQMVKNILPSSVYRELLKLRYLLLSVTGRMKIEVLVVSVGQACNLRCRDCGTLAPFSPKEFRRYRFEDIVDSLDIIFKRIHQVNCIQIQGGEPFLYSDLDKLIKYLGNKMNLGGVLHDVQIATNGSIMPSPEMLKLIKDNNITIRISDYSIVHQQAQVLKKKCEEMAIPCFYHEFAANNAMWYFCGDKDMSRDPDNRRVKKKFNECKLHSCLTLERGELSYCSRAANSYVIQKFTRQEQDFVKVEDTQSFVKELCNYITFRHPMEACRYCNGSEEKYLVAPAIQLKEEDGKTEERGV